MSDNFEVTQIILAWNLSILYKQQTSVREKHFKDETDKNLDIYLFLGEKQNTFLFILQLSFTKYFIWSVETKYFYNGKYKKIVK